MPEIVFHPKVSIEIKSSYEWYQCRADGLGEDFLSELDSAVSAIEELPETWPKFRKGFRRFILSKFPFSVVYRTKNDSIFIVAVMHNSRKPDYWLERGK